MKYLYGLIFIFLLSLLLILIFAVIIHFEKRSIKKTVEKEKMRISIVNDSIQIAIAIQNLNKKDELKKFPLLKEYLDQVFCIFKKDIYNFDGIIIVPIMDCGNGETQSFNVDQFLFEYRKAPRALRKQVNALSDVFAKIYELTNPKEYKITKYRMIVRILFGKYQKRAKNTKCIIEECLIKKDYEDITGIEPLTRIHA